MTSPTNSWRPLGLDGRDWCDESEETMRRLVCPNLRDELLAAAQLAAGWALRRLSQGQQVPCVGRLMAIEDYCRI